MSPIVLRMTHKVIGMWTRLRRPVTLGVKAAIFNDEGAVLLVRHTYVDGWHLPGGGVERDETAEDAVAREVLEELGLQVTGTPELRGVYFAPHRGKSDHIMLFRTQVASFDLSTNWEIAEAVFFPPEALPGGATQATKNRVAELCFDKRPATSWFA